MGWVPKYEYDLIYDLILSWRRLLSYRNQSIDLESNGLDWFLYNRDIRHERVKLCAKYWHCMKSVHIWSYSGPHFPTYGLNKERYFVVMLIGYGQEHENVAIVNRFWCSHPIFRACILISHFNVMKILNASLKTLWQFVN